jgi:prevent-host-death family protein
MATTFNLYQAKTQLSKLVERGAAGEEIVIAKAGKPMARLGPLEASRPKRLREPGLLKGKVWVAEDFDEWPEDILAAFEADIEPAEEASTDDPADERR